MQNLNDNKTIALHTLGCKLNYSETSTIGRLFEEKGFSKKKFNEIADVYVINTCSVTENADKECKQLIRKTKKLNPQAKVIITGCYAQLQPEKIAEIEGVDMVVGTEEKMNIVAHYENLISGNTDKIHSCEVADILTFNSTYSLHDRTRTFLKVQDGCDYNCSFCTIPLARGKSRSHNIEGVLHNIEVLHAHGIQEIVLTGINLGDFGAHGFDNETFYDLLIAIESKAQVPRFRISSIEPNLLSTEIIDLVSQSQKIMPHFHIPLQSGSNTILGKMRRRYRRELYAEKVEIIKALIPHCCIGVDVIVGFPGENEMYFQETYDFLSSLPISYLHVFTYSERADTLAATMLEVVPIHVRKSRNTLLRHLSDKKLQHFTQQHVGSNRPVLFEMSNENGYMEGYTDNYIKVVTPYNKEKAGRILLHTIE